MDVPNVPVSEPVEPSTGARTASASQHNTRLRRRTRESGASTAVDDAQHEKSALAPASDALPVTDRENPPEGRVAWDTTRPGGTRASVEIPTRPSPAHSSAVGVLRHSDDFERLGADFSLLRTCTFSVLLGSCESHTFSVLL